MGLVFVARLCLSMFVTQSSRERRLRVLHPNSLSRPPSSVVNRSSGDPSMLHAVSLLAPLLNTSDLREVEFAGLSSGNRAIGSVELFIAPSDVNANAELALKNLWRRPREGGNRQLMRLSPFAS